MDLFTVPERMFTNQLVIFWCTEQKWGPYFLQKTIGSPFIPQKLPKNNIEKLHFGR